MLTAMGLVIFIFSCIAFDQYNNRKYWQRKAERLNTENSQLWKERNNLYESSRLGRERTSLEFSGLQGDRPEKTL